MRLPRAALGPGAGELVVVDPLQGVQRLASPPGVLSVPQQILELGLGPSGGGRPLPDRAQGPGRGDRRVGPRGMLRSIAVSGVYCSSSKGSSAGPASTGRGTM